MSPVLAQMWQGRAQSWCRRKLDEHQRETELMQAEQQRHLDMQQQVRPFPPGPHTHTLGPYTLTHHITEPTHKRAPRSGVLLPPE